MLSGCSFIEPKTVYIRQPIPVVHPEAPAPLTLRNPEITVANQEELQRIAADPANANSFFYVLSQDAMQASLSDDADKLLLTKQQQRIIQYYRNLLEDYNRRVLEENQQPVE